jgi:pRiA4b ORF-3-like protein
VDTVEGLRDAARQARECAIMGDAVALARWIGAGRRPVTAGRVLRKADVAAAGAALGVDVPTRLRTMADIRALHRPWCVAVATGLLQVEDAWVTAGPTLEAWPSDDGDLLAGWLAGLRAAAEGMSSLRRSVAVRLVEALGDDALPAWRELVAARCVGPFARAVLAAWDDGPEPGAADGDWLGVEGAAAALEEKGPDEALSRVWESMPGTDLDDRLAAVRATGHPDADALATAVAEFAGSGAPRSIDQVAQLKVSLAGYRPAVWRRVLLPATVTLGDLHEVIQVLFGWDGDHLHVFEVGKKQYSDPYVNLEGTGNEEAVRVGDAMAPGGKVLYTYDLGACWRHEITLETTVPRDHSQQYPVCVAFRGDSPVEYWSEKEPEEPEPFSLNEVNRRLAALGREVA